MNKLHKVSKLALQSAADKAGLGVIELATKSRVKFQTVARLMSAGGNASAYDVEMLAQACNVAPTAILAFDESW